MNTLYPENISPDKVADFFHQYRNVLDENRFKDLYAYANDFKTENILTAEDIGYITCCLYNAGVDPLSYKHVKMIPREFLNATDIETFEIPKHINIIGPYAFAGCRNLKAIKLPRDLIFINESFSHCDNLTNVFYDKTCEDFKMIRIYATSKSDVNINCSDGTIRGRI